MTEFYTWTQFERIFVSLLIVFCVLTQILAAVLSYYRNPHSNHRYSEDLLELFLLFHIIVLSLLMGQVQLSYYSGLIAPTGYIELRYITVACIVPFTCIVVMHSKNAWHLFVIMASCLTLPIAENVFGNAYAWFYITALFFWLLRGVNVCIHWYRIIKVSISALSVKDAVDSLHTGVLFSESDGFITLVNTQMQRLMTVTTGKIYRNSLHFYKTLMLGELLPRCQKTEYEGQIVCLLPDETAWVFIRTEIRIKNKSYIQLTATDITNRWALTSELRRQEELLIIRGEELREMIANLQALSRAREFQNAKLRTHDILGQYLTMLLHTINSGQPLDYNLLQSQLQSLLHDLKSSGNEASPRGKMDNLQRTFKTIDVEICLDGDLPEDNTKGHVFVDIISESVVNAVRHAFATKIFAKVDHLENIWHLEITDNGSVHLPPAQIIEGGGIGGMRAKVESQGGSLVVVNTPRFMLKIELPGGNINV